MNETLEQQIINHFNIQEFELKALDALVYELWHGPLYLVDEENSVFNDWEFSYDNKNYYFGDWSTEGCYGDVFPILTEIVSNLIERLNKIYVTEDKDWLMEKEPEGEWALDRIEEDLEELIEKYKLPKDTSVEDILYELTGQDCYDYWYDPEEYYIYEDEDILAELIGYQQAREIMRTL